MDAQTAPRESERLTALPAGVPLRPAAAEVQAERRPTSQWQIVRWCVFVGVGYYVAARIGFMLQSPQVPQSVLWLPNSLLLAVLLVAPTRRWGWLLLSSLPAQLLVAWQSHSPFEAMSFLFATNCADAVLGATTWRIVSPNEPRILGLRQMVAFIGLSATVPTLLVSFLDAGITVASGWSHDYWLVFATRARANVLTNLLFVPPAVALLGLERRASLAELQERWIEVSCMLAGLIGTTWLAFTQRGDSVSSPALAYLPLVFVVWSAVRFGVAMTGLALFSLACLTTWMAMAGIHSVPPRPGADIVAALQFELLAIAVPVLCLCAVVQDRERATTALTLSQRALNQSLAQIRNLAGRLLSATEVERARIARELHDDVNQQLAALGIGLSALKRHLPSDEQLRDEVATLQRQAMHAADTVRVLSHELHPAALRHAGLVPAMRELCAQYGRGDSMRVNLVARQEMTVPHEIALCLYRVTQEALRNAARHSGAKTVQVVLRMTGDVLELDVEDEGRGFDEQVARRRGGLGLTSIDERVRLVSGTVRVDSAPGRGTRISVRIPNLQPQRNGPTDAPARR